MENSEVVILPGAQLNAMRRTSLSLLPLRQLSSANPLENSCGTAGR